MTDKRFTVIEGGGQQDRAITPSYEQHVCAKCSDVLGWPYDRLVQVRVGAVVKDGKLEGGRLYWCCGRCGHPYYEA